MNLPARLLAPLVAVILTGSACASPARTTGKDSALAEMTAQGSVVTESAIRSAVPVTNTAAAIITSTPNTEPAKTTATASATASDRGTATAVAPSTTPAPAASQTPDPTATARAAVPVFRGSYTGWSVPLYLGPFPLRAGVTVVRARHNGNSNFAVSLFTPKLGAPPPGPGFSQFDWTDLLINSAGAYSGAAATLVPKDGDYYLSVGAAGAYEFRVEQPTPETAAPVSHYQFAGGHQQVTEPVYLSAGPARIRATSTGNLNLIVWMYRLDDLGGAAVSKEYDGRLINVSGGPHDLSVTTELFHDGLYLFHVYAAPDNARWTLQIE